MGIQEIVNERAIVVIVLKYNFTKWANQSFEVSSGGGVSSNIVFSIIGSSRTSKQDQFVLQQSSRSGIFLSSSSHLSCQSNMCSIFVFQLFPNHKSSSISEANRIHQVQSCEKKVKITLSRAQESRNRSLSGSLKGTNVSPEYKTNKMTLRHWK